MKLLSMLALMACSTLAYAETYTLNFSNSVASVQFDPGPVSRMYVKMNIEFRDAATKQLKTPEGATEVQVETLMDHHGNPHPGTPIDPTDVLSGRAQLEEVYFMMDGEWTVNVSLVSNGTVLEAQTFTVNVK